MQKYGDNWTQSTMETQCIIIFWESCIMSTHSSLTKKEGYVISIQGCLTEFKEKGSQVYEQLESITGKPSWVDCPFLWDHIRVLSLLHLASLFQSFSQFLFCFFSPYTVETLLCQTHIYTTTHISETRQNLTRGSFP